MAKASEDKSRDFATTLGILESLHIWIYRSGGSAARLLGMFIYLSENPPPHPEL